ncbi:hypothetical protein [Piscirickettsia salmonis]|uniref:hypothetical protein n=1 Tax=Piscirickettsia salmonis TaxID=1238 RepID=UPI003A7F9ED3
MLGDFASLDVQNTYRGSDAYVSLQSSKKWVSNLVREKGRPQLRCNWPGRGRDKL